MVNFAVLSSNATYTSADRISALGVKFKLGMYFISFYHECFPIETYPLYGSRDILNFSALLFVFWPVQYMLDRRYIHVIVLVHCYVSISQHG